MKSAEKALIDTWFLNLMHSCNVQKSNNKALLKVPITLSIGKFTIVFNLDPEKTNRTPSVTGFIVQFYVLRNPISVKLNKATRSN